MVIGIRVFGGGVEDVDPRGCNVDMRASTCQTISKVFKWRYGGYAYGERITCGIEWLGRGAAVSGRSNDCDIEIMNFF